MISRRSLFLKHIAQTSEFPAIIDVAMAEGIYITDQSGKKYIDLSSGIGPNILGHKHPKVQEALHKQSNAYLHTMVYGEHIQSPQIELAQLLVEKLPDSLKSVYFLSSGSEAIEAALKVAKVYQNKYEIIAAKSAYHGSTIGAESLRSDTDFTKNIAPLVPGIKHITFGNVEDLELISEETAAVIMEPVQAEAGVLEADTSYMVALRKRCDDTDTLLIFDEIQVGLGRTGHLFCFERYGICPDILVLGKAIGGGLPLSAVIADQKVMAAISHRVPLAHLTTFGGHPLCCATGLATLKFIVENQLWTRANEIGHRFAERLKDGPWSINQVGAMIGFEVESEAKAVDWQTRLHNAGIVTDLLLFNLCMWRIAPPLTISNQEIDASCEIILGLVE